ncbi:hypothetical protein [Janthinobacterium lividum]|uniref:Uncharacterized protein n=1 Tax=Janthinobacterium lividum TaxID=29581 RepID=A0ABU0XND0_9BURK|nr:hypothetical protein [Janthinobacterium lividum]MDQ4625028.1 hypothetical protein [Janthinobacterium lividum]MDQ4673369.1 hypothetical protein [Janthinobacterium lividum]MDQ4684099.1 hypothetical protein [Janthinobacterium lividum]
MTASSLLSRLGWRRSPIQVAAIVGEIAPAEPPTQQEVIDQLDADVVRHFQRMLNADVDFL